MSDPIEAILQGGAEPLPPIEELLLLLQREIAAGPAAPRAAELKVRAALLLWDGRGQAAAALELLQGVDHPVATALRLQAALDGDEQALTAFADEVIRRGDRGDDGEAAELGELLLFRGEAARAAQLLERAGEEERPLRALALCLSGRYVEAVEVLAASPDPQALLLAAHLCEDRLMDAERARTLLRRLLDREGRAPAPQLLAIERLLDLEARRPGDPGRSDLLRRKLDLLCGAAPPRRLEEALAAPRPQHAELFLTALQLGQALEKGAAAEAAPLLQAAHRYCAASAEGAAALGHLMTLRAHARVEAACGRPVPAAELFAELGERLGKLAGDEDPAPALGALAVAHRRRAAEMLESRDPARAHALFEQIFAAAPADPALCWSLLRSHLSAGDGRGAAQALGRHADAASGDQALLRAARAAEACRDGQRELLLDIDPADRGGLEALCRVLRRRGDRPRLCAAYRRLGDPAAGGGSGAPAETAASRAERRAPDRSESSRRGPGGGGGRAALHQAAGAGRAHGTDDQRSAGPAQPVSPGAGDARRAAAYHAACCALALEALPAREAEALLAGSGEPDGDLLPKLARALFYRRQGNAEQLAEALGALLPLVAAPETRADLHLQLARAAEAQGDSARAQRHYEQALYARPGAVPALLALGRLRRRTHPAEALGLLRQAADAALRLPAAEAAGAPGPGGPGDGALGARAAALILCELASLHEQAGADGHAAACYEEALRTDGACRPAAEALVRLGHRGRSPEEILPRLEQILPLLQEASVRRHALCEIGRAAEALAQAGGAPAGGGAAASPAADAARHLERAIAAYGEAVRTSGEQLSDDDEALDRLRHLSLLLGRPGALRDALQAAPRTARILGLLGEALQGLGDYAQLAQVREQELALLREPQDVLRAARALAELCETQLPAEAGREAAARAWARAYQVAPEATLTVPGVPERLAALFEEKGRYGELAGLLGRRAEDIERRLQAAGDPPLLEEQRRALLQERRALLLRLGAVRREHLHAPQEAAAALEAVLREHPEDPEALAALSKVYVGEERSGELRRVLDLRARSTHDPVERCGLLLQAGELSEKAGDLEAAQREYQEAFELDPTSRSAFTSLERVLYRRERWDEVMRMYSLAIALVEEHKSRAYRLGDLYARRGQVLLQYLQRPDEAAVAYQKALEADPDSDAPQAALERIHVAAGSWADLIACYERRVQLLRDDAKRVEVLRRAARVAAAKLKDLPEAIRLYRLLHGVDPTDSEALDALERHYERSRDHEKLLGVLSTRLAISPGDSEAAALGMRIGQIYEEGLRDHDKAIEAYRQVLEHVPNHREALDGLARLFEANERWAELVEVSRRQIRLTTDRTQKALLYFKCGSVMEAKFGKEDDAVRYYEAAVKTSPSCLPAVHGLRDIYLRREDWPRVTQTLELEAKLWTEDKERAGIYAHIGQIYREKLQDLERAIQYYESALAVDRECLPANRALFEVYFERGDWSRAVPMSQVLSAKVNREGEPAERSDFYRKRAQVAEHTGDLRAAAESLVVALEIQPENLRALELLVQLCRRDPTVYDFGATFRELEKLYRRRGHDRGLGLALTARAAVAERAYDIEEAEQLLGEAQRLSPGDYAVTEALVALSERLRRFSAAERTLRAFIERCAQEGGPEACVQRARALLRLAEMYSDAAMEPEQSAATLREVLRLPGAPPDLLRVARYRLVQDLYLLGRYPEARAEIDLLIEEAVRPPEGEGKGSMAPPEELARYYDYLGRILEATGEGPAAQRNYRRAVDLDPAYAQPVLALARRAAQAGDRAQAELLIRDALSQAQRRGDPQEELKLRRGVARLLATFDPGQAIEAYRQTIQFGTGLLPPDALKAAELLGLPTGAQFIARETLDDRLAVADLLLSLGDVGGAQRELVPVLQRDLRHAPAYRLLAQAYEQLGEIERAQRVHAVLSLLGYGEPQRLGSGGALYRPSVRRGTLDDDARERLLLPPGTRGPLLELLQAIAERIDCELPPPWPPPGGGESVLAVKVADAGFKVCMTDVSRLFGVEVEVHVARGVQGGVLALPPAAPGAPPRLYWEAALLDRPDGERRFLLGRALEPLRGGYAVAQRLRPREREEVGQLLLALLRPEAEWDALARETYRALPRRSQRTVERLAGAEVPQPAAFFQALGQAADRAGLLACDDLLAAMRVLGRLQGEDLAVVDGSAGGVLVGQVVGGPDLIRFFLSDGYQELRAAVRDATRL